MNKCLTMRHHHFTCFCFLLLTVCSLRKKEKTDFLAFNNPSDSWVFMSLALIKVFDSNLRCT